MNGILVVCEQSARILHPMSLEALAAGQFLSRELGSPLIACLFGDDTSAAAAQVARFSAESVIRLEHDALGLYTADGAVAALAAFIGETSPQIVLFPHTYQVRDFAPALAVRCGRPLVSDVTAIGLDNGSLLFGRRLFRRRLFKRRLFSGRILCARYNNGGCRVFLCWFRARTAGCLPLPGQGLFPGGHKFGGCSETIIWILGQGLEDDILNLWR